MDKETFKIILVVILAFGFLIFQKPINRFFNHFLRREKLKKTLLNPITATASSIYLIIFILKSGLFSFLLKLESELIIFIYLAILAVPIYSFTDFYLRKFKNKNIKNHWLKEGAYLGAELILIADIVFTILFIYKLLTGQPDF